MKYTYKEEAKPEPIEEASGDAEVHVEDARGGQTKIFANFDKAAAFAVHRAISHGEDVHMDIVLWNRRGAKKWGMEDAYDLDPEASIHERLVVNVQSQGLIP